MCFSNSVFDCFYQRLFLCLCNPVWAKKKHILDLSILTGCDIYTLTHRLLKNNTWCFRPVPVKTLTCLEIALPWLYFFSCNSCVALSVPRKKVQNSAAICLLYHIYIYIYIYLSFMCLIKYCVFKNEFMLCWLHDEWFKLLNWNNSYSFHHLGSTLGIMSCAMS